MPTARAEALLQSPISLELFYLMEWRQETSLTSAELVSRAIEARNSASVYRGDYNEHLRFLRDRAPRYEARAEWVASLMERWWAPIDRRAQVWAHRTSSPPSASELVTDLSQFSPETPKPKRTLWTCTFAPMLISPWLHWSENHPPESQRLWKLGVPDTARIAEVHSPADWWGLVRAYPAKTHGFRYAVMPLRSHPDVVTQDRSEAHARLDPDWHAVARDWDGVHLSMAGVMTAEDVAYERHGVVTELRSWDVESTVWLRWVFTSVEALPPP